MPLVKSVSYACKGLAHIFKTESSFRFQVVFGFLVIVLMFVFPLAVWQRIIITLLVGSVLVLEVINSVFERILDAFKPRVHPVVADLKNMMAGAVLITSAVSAIVGLFIFLPYLLELFGLYI